MKVTVMTQNLQGVNCPLKFYKEFCLQAAKAQREREAHLRAQLADAMEALHENPCNLELQGRLSDSGELLGMVEKTHVEGLKVRN